MSTVAPGHDPGQGGRAQPVVQRGDPQTPRDGAGEGLVGERQVGRLLRLRRHPARTAYVTVGLRAPEPGLGLTGLLEHPGGEIGPAGGQRARERVERVRAAGGRSHAAARRSRRRPRRSRRSRRRTTWRPGGLARNRGSSGSSSRAGPTGHTSASSSPCVCPRTDARHSSARSPGSTTTTTDTRPDLSRRCRPARRRP